MKKIFFLLFIIFSITNSSYAAGSSSNTKTTTSNYDKAVKLIKFAKKYENLCLLHFECRIQLVFYS